MSDPIPNTPVVVNNNPVPGAVASLTRTAIVSACAYAVAQGWFGQSVADQLIPVGIGLATIAYGTARNWLLHSRLADFANILPDSIAITK